VTFRRGKDLGERLDQFLVGPLPGGPTAIRKVVGRSNRYSVPAVTPNRKMPAARIRSE